MLQLIVLLGLVVGAATSASTQPTATLALGTVYGSQCGVSTAFQFLGLRYAKAPVGPLRWAPPQMYDTPNSQPINATSFGSECVQLSIRSAVEGDEDCLFVNVWTPAGATATSALPVRVFIHGGAYVQGTGNAYSGCSSTALTNTLTVTFNYRLNTFGFFSTSDLQTSSPFGNYGLMDQRLALKWVQANIAAFGGDPKKVLLFGQSAGSASTFMHLLMPRSANLFRAVICESGSLINPDTVAVANEWGSALQTALNCTANESTARGFASTTACLQNASSNAIMAVASLLSSTVYKPYPIIDGTDLVQSPFTWVKAGVFNDVDLVVIGSNLNDYTYLTWTSFFTINISDTTYNNTIKSTVPPSYQDMLSEQYSQSLFPVNTNFNAISMIGTDLRYRCTGWQALPYLAASANIGATHAYLYAHVPSCNVYRSIGVPDATAPALGSSHANEIFPVFDFEQVVTTGGALCSFSSDEVAMSHEMANQWAQAAANGTVSWTTWSSEKPYFAVWNTTYSTVEQLNYTCVCQLWVNVQEYPTSPPAGSTACPVSFNSIPIVTTPSPTNVPTSTSPGDGGSAAIATPSGSVVLHLVIALVLAITVLVTN